MIVDDPHDPMMFRYPEELQVETTPAASSVWPLCLSGIAAICLLLLTV